MPSLHIIDAQHTVPLATLNYIYTGVGANSVVVEEPLDINGQIAGGD